ncbi:hypothetical protein [Hymenobacter jeollabukensis]|uniref:Uncharacterized protein n=1 Tax=Hymenobacter jeollabukensis TaxID=2025313 RepID=A0A5R8WJM7_9BACT|nr:hypothetical protein [Hymenobacter jeollabukensis]TLM88813.1 hypothetical protein FDY95_23550 [Hymenobacter jeollabukensis]
MEYFISDRQKSLFRPERTIYQVDDWASIEKHHEFQYLGLQDDPRHDHYGKPLVYDSAEQAPTLTHWKLNVAQWERFACRHRLSSDKAWMLDEIIKDLRRRAWIAGHQRELDYRWHQALEQYEQAQQAAAERHQQRLAEFHSQPFPSRLAKPAKGVVVQTTLF